MHIKICQGNKSVAQILTFFVSFVNQRLKHIKSFIPMIQDDAFPEHSQRKIERSPASFVWGDKKFFTIKHLSKIDKVLKAGVFHNISVPGIGLPIAESGGNHNHTAGYRK